MNARALRHQVSVIGAGLQAALLAVMLGVPGTLARDSSQAAPAPLSGLESAVQSGLDAGLPGIALLVERNGERVTSTAAGMASVENQTPVTTADRFRIYSIAKTFTATVVLQLVDEGILDLDDTVDDWLDDPAVAAIPNVERITLRQLLTHSSGIYDFADDHDSPFWSDAFLGPDADWAKVWTLPELLAYADGANHAPYFAPGEGWAYSNTGYLLLGMIVEAATGNAYGDELQARILEPLGLHNTTLAEGGDMPDDIVAGYHLVDGQRLNVSETNLSWIWTGGGMISTTEDLARFAQATFTGELLSPASFAEMFTFLPTGNPYKGEGMGVYSIATPNGTLIGMDGAGPGGESSMMHLPDAGITVVILANIAPAGAIVEGFRDEVFRLALAGSQAPSATPAAALPEIPATPVGDQLSWLIELLNTSAATAESDDVAAHFTPAVLAQLPSEAVIATAQEFAGAFGPFTFEGLARPAAPYRLVALLSGRNGASFLVVVGTETAPPHLLTGAAILPAPPLAAMAAMAPESLVGQFDIGGRTLFLSCSGTGSPTVVLEAGYGDSSGLWAPVQNGLAPLTRVCVYDRANVFASASDPAETPRTAQEQVADLHALLAEAGVPGPYVFGAHFYGGLIARLYAATNPEDVAGMVLVDSVHEDRAMRRQGLVSPEQWAEAQELEARFSDFEQIDQEGSWEEVRAARAAAPFPAMPLVVLAAGGSIDPSFFPPGWPLAYEERLHQELQEDLAGLVPNGRYLLVAESGHYVQLDQPEVVIDAIGDVVAAVRKTSPAATPIGGTPTIDIRGASLNDVLQAGLDQGLTGIALHIEQGDEVIFDRAAGLASIETGIALAPSDRFRIYSITKTFTAILILQLVDDGILSLDDTVTDWLDAPEVRAIPNVNRITLRQLPTYTSGVYDYFDADSPFWNDAYLGANADWSRVWTPRELLAYADGARHAAYFDPGEGAHYSNTGYILLGLIVEEATGQQFAERLHDTILEPLGLRDTYFAATEPVRGGIVDGYHLIDGELVNVSETHLSAQWAEGGMVSTTRDLARFADAVFRGELLGPDSVQEMFTVVPSEKPGIAWGMGLARMQTPAGELVGMAGDGPGFPPACSASPCRISPSCS
jgi:D-alanyl-D-alanine carboxypeptidase